jgi:hypothetical protein
LKSYYAVLFLALFPALLISGGLSEPATRSSAMQTEAAEARPDGLLPEASGALSGLAGERPFLISYAGSEACMDCHQEIYRRFKTTAKARTRTLVEKMLPKLTGEEQKTCFQCHATGYGQQGGFVSYAQTPHLGDIGCEACHGPGSEHIRIRAQDRRPETALAETLTEAIRMPEAETCASCHTPERGGAPATVRMFGGNY